MKRNILICVVLILVLICQGTMGIAEDFSVRGGINFNTTKDEILKYEESVPGTYRMVDSEYLFYSDNCIVCKDISFAGYDTCHAIYYLGENDELLSIIYTVDIDVDSETEAQQAYLRLSSALTEKYGEPIAETNFPKSDKAYTVKDVVNKLNKNGTLFHTYGYKQWLYPAGDYYVGIEIEYILHISFFNSDLSTVISYTKITDEAITEQLEKEQNSQQSIQNDI